MPSKLWCFRRLDQAVRRYRGLLTTVLRSVCTEWQDDPFFLCVWTYDALSSPFHWKRSEDSVDLQWQSDALDL